ncbi:ABC transporter ATP-binding protein [Micromonospora sp. MA102]|uniref:ABC transporter ATP-binding protein n=1 Tax=Micromonospora sp. MA102 TaxID=2952755 RepID=UPI0021C570DA|nr:ABC transporter ATP-binding protein [Micromonospora sp. MA102]
MSELVRTRQLRAGYGRVEVLRGADLVVDEGEVVVLLGANGAGKTTLLRALSGVIPGRGEITFAGRSIVGLSADRVARLGIAHVPQGRGTFVDMTVEDNLRVGGYARRDAAGVRADLARWLEFFPRLGERRDQLAGSMSGGEQQMLAVARALMSRPRLLLLDEPSLGLAPVVTKELFAKLAELNAENGTSMLVVEQAAHLALGIAARAYTLTAGELSASMGVDELADRESLRRVYLGS